MKTFEQLLDVREFTALYRAVDSIQDYPFTKTFYQNPRNVESDSVEMISLSGITRPAPGNVRNGTARVLSPRGGTRKEATLFRIFNEVVAPGDALKALREPESFAMQDKGRQVIDLANEEVALCNRMHKEVVFSQILTSGRVNLDANGEILVPAVNATSGAITDAGNTLISADFGVANNRRGNLGGLVSALWSVAGTKISDQLEAIRYDALKHGAPAPTEVYVQPPAAAATTTSSCKPATTRANTAWNDSIS